MRMEDSACRWAEGSEKSESGASWNRDSGRERQLLSFMCVRVERSNTGIVPDHWPITLSILAVAEDTKMNATIGRKGDAVDDWRRQRREQQQDKGDEE